MIKKVIIAAIMISILSLSILYSINDSKSREESYNKDIVSKIFIDNQKINVKYVNGNLIDSNILYGNVLEKEIYVENKNEKDVIFAIKFKDVTMSSNSLKYYLSFKNNELDTYQEISDGLLSGNINLGYNLIVKSKSILYLKITFKGNNEFNATNVKGKFEVVSNISNKDAFISNFNNLHSHVLDKINEKNGINENGNYILKIDSLLSDFNGYVLIDAQDFTDLIFYYSICDTNYCIDNYRYSSKFSKSKLNDFSENYISDLSFDNVCKKSNKKNCKDFNEIKKDESGGIKKFNDESLDLIKKVEKDFKKRKLNKLVYIYDAKKDIKNDYDIRGYILVDNRDKPEFYIYLTNEKYMISGYNITKLGDFTPVSNTIRQYRESAFNLSSENMNKVCEFTKIDKCYKLNGEEIN